MDKPLSLAHECALTLTYLQKLILTQSLIVKLETCRSIESGYSFSLQIVLFSNTIFKFEMLFDFNFVFCPIELSGPPMFGLQAMPTAAAVAAAAATAKIQALDAVATNLGLVG